jgi:nucleoid-associated protein YgaU
VRAVDTSGNVDGTPARYTWTIDAAPDTAITSAIDGTGTALANEAVTLSTSLTLSFTGTDNVALSRFECQLDGAGFSTCTSPLAYNGLTLGRHTFEVRAVDTSNNADGTPARHTWTIDATPETTINSAVDGHGKSLANGGRTTSDKVTFRFAGTDNGTIARFECRLDRVAFTSCTSPVTYGTVSRGTHTFRVRAVDNSGFADPSPAVFSWTR